MYFYGNNFTIAEKQPIINSAGTYIHKSRQFVLYQILNHYNNVHYANSIRIGHMLWRVSIKHNAGIVSKFLLSFAMQHTQVIYNIHIVIIMHILSVEFKGAVCRYCLFEWSRLSSLVISQYEYILVITWVWGEAEDEC